ncbi:MAG: hypothetical protein WA668_11995 [Candidatus Cybelea sp.]
MIKFWEGLGVGLLLGRLVQNHELRSIENQVSAQQKFLSQAARESVRARLKDLVEELAQQEGFESASAPVKINLEMSGPAKQITSELANFRDDLMRELAISAADREIVASLPLNRDRRSLTTLESVTDAIPQIPLGQALREAASAVAKFKSTISAESDLVEIRLHTLVRATGVLITSLLSIERTIKEAPFPVAFSRTQSALVGMCDATLRELNSWVNALDSKITNHSAGRRFAIRLEFHCDVQRTIKTFVEDARSASRQAS